MCVTLRDEKFNLFSIILADDSLIYLYALHLVIMKIAMFEVDTFEYFKIHRYVTLSPFLQD